jgi:RimJ/RimL family protein N-acetyltransferase
MINAIKCDVSHLTMFKPRSLYDGEDYLEICKMYVMSPLGISHTLMWDNEILGCIGFMKVWPGVADTWTLFSEGIVKHGKALTEKIAFMHNFYEENLKIHRTQCNVKVENVVAVKWAEKLGYKIEGTLQSFGKYEEDYFVMARTRKNGGIIWQ